MERGRRTEVDSYNGFISLKGAEYRINTPVNQKLTAMVKEIEAGKRKISAVNLKEV